MNKFMNIYHNDIFKNNDLKNLNSKILYVDPSFYVNKNKKQITNFVSNFKNNNIKLIFLIYSSLNSKKIIKLLD